MASFPALKTGAVMQYPADRTPQFSTQAYRFLDGSEQRFPGFPGVLQQWTIRLDLLDEGELENSAGVFPERRGARREVFVYRSVDGDGVCELQLRERHAVARISGSAEWRDASGGEGEPVGCWCFRNW